MPEIETILLVLVVIAALLGGMFSRASQGLVAVLAAFGYFIAAFFLFDKSDPLWFVTLMMGFALSAVLAMAGAFAGRVLSKLLPPRA
ncbi:hypothetical protein GCM10023115_14890 [Pontixanthobacter gangjinensis]|uniref:Uncharacterized protein n=1 Tax=Pontixanthobacter gangjinensis TaxID=1028742 RepID=A0A6I4SM33_9SPHN|nr:hypothetical protein [Pontixanthobacter gangjinensis]MXO56734.1 hypothetical protein [Pontixanthobacter gangjinensis]